MEIFNFGFSTLAIIVGYYYSRKYSHVDLLILMWFGVTNLLVDIWSYYNKHVLHLSGTAGDINAVVIRIYGVIVLVIFIKLFINIFNKDNYIK